MNAIGVGGMVGILGVRAWGTGWREKKKEREREKKEIDYNNRGWRVINWLGFPDHWSGQKPWWNRYLTLWWISEVQRAQLAKFTLLTSTVVPLGSFSDLLRSVQMLNKEWSTESNRKLPHLFIPSKTATLVPEFAVENLPLGRTATLVSEFAVKILPLGRTLWWLLYHHSVLPKGCSIMQIQAPRLQFCQKTNSGSKVAALLRMNRCGSFPLLSTIIYIYIFIKCLNTSLKYFV